MREELGCSLAGSVRSKTARAGIRAVWAPLFALVFAVVVTVLVDGVRPTVGTKGQLPSIRLMRAYSASLSLCVGSRPLSNPYMGRVWS
jgi:hypothetical protein